MALPARVKRWRSPRRLRPSTPEPRDQVAVDLDRLEALDAIEQHGGQRAETGADLDETLARLRRDRIDDRGQDRRVGQEVLAEALARRVLHRSSSRSST